MTYEDVCAQYGWSMEFVERIHEALGLLVPSAEDRVREDWKPLKTRSGLTSG